MREMVTLNRVYVIGLHNVSQVEPTGFLRLDVTCVSVVKNDLRVFDP